MPTYLAGRHAVFHAVKAGRRPVRTIYLQAGINEREVRPLLELARSQGIPVETVPKDFFARHLSVETHQGVAAAAEELPVIDLEALLAKLPSEAPQRLLLLDSVEDPHNFGALMRSALSFGFQGVIWPRRRSAPLSAVAVKAAAGAAEYLHLVRVGNLNQAMEALKARQYWIYGSVAEGGQDPQSEDFPRSAALVIGSEGRGLHRLVQERCDALLTIPCEGPLESLNASVAGALLMAAMRSQNHST